MARIPGMLFILLSFAPWIIYWTIGEVTIPFIISILLMLRKDFLMDLVSFLYFLVATLGIHALQLTVFISERGFLGYLVLFIMAFSSIIMKKPYTLQVSKRDYPRIYWEDKHFLAINSVVTASWASIFLVNSILFIFLASPYNIIFSNFFIALGIIFSIILPIKIPAYIVSKDFKKYDWKVKPSNYDVIIIGSGIGGLTCGCLLSKRGFKVLVLEQHQNVGGYCSSFRRGSFIFNSGVIDVSGLGERGPITYLLKELGLKKEDFFTRNSVEYILKGRRIRIMQNLTDTLKNLYKEFPEEEESIHRFFEDVEKSYYECYKDAKFYGTVLPPELIVKVFGEKKIADYPKEHPNFYTWLDKTFAEKLDEYFRDKDLKYFLGGLSPYTGTEPQNTSAVMGLTVWMGYFLEGGYFMNAQSFVDALSNFIKSHGGEVKTNHEVTNIIVKKKSVQGVIVGGKTFRSSIVVANANAKLVFLKLIDKKELREEFLEYIKNLKMSPSCFVAYLGVDLDLSRYPTLIKNLDEGYEIAIISNSDRSLAPEGKSAVLILADAEYQDFQTDYKKRKREFARELIDKANKVIEGLSENIEVLDAATPKTMERYTLTPEGALYSFDQSIRTKRPSFKSPIKGLYLVGASTFPGGGIEGCTISGIICANDICNWSNSLQLH